MATKNRKRKVHYHFTYGYRINCKDHICEEDITLNVPASIQDPFIWADDLTYAFINYINTTPPENYQGKNARCFSNDDN